MSKCGYYSCYKGTPSCNHPEKGKYLKPKDFSSSWGSIHQCDRCKRQCGGIYPSELPRVDFRNEEYDVVDKAGKVVS